MAWGSAAAAEDEGANWARHRHRNMKPEKENGEFIVYRSYFTVWRRCFINNIKHVF